MVEKWLNYLQTVETLIRCHVLFAIYPFKISSFQWVKNTTAIAGSSCNTSVVTIGNLICLKRTKDFMKPSSVEIPFESHIIAVIFDELSTC